MVTRIIQAAQDGQKFKVCFYARSDSMQDAHPIQVVVVIPEVPGFAGNIRDESSVKTIMAAQYRTINRGGHSIYEEIRKAGYEP